MESFMHYYISVELKENTIIIETPSINNTTIFNITSIVINQLLNNNDINISFQNIENEILEQYNFHIKIGEVISKIIID